MKKLLFAAMFLASMVIAPLPTIAQVGVDVDVGLPPPPFEFEEEPYMMPLPDTNNVYAAPGIDADLFFWNDWWWRLWQGSWYRSRYYDQGWGYYGYAPSFYYDIDPGWRGYYRDRNWYGNSRGHEQFDHQRPQPGRQGRHNNRGWENEQNWGDRNYRPRTQYQDQELRQQRQQQYRQRPEVRQYEQQRQSLIQQPRYQYQERAKMSQRPNFQQRQERQFQVQQPRQQYQARTQQFQRQEQRPRVQQPRHSRPQGRPEWGGRT